MTLCHCNRAPRGFGYAKPETGMVRIPACSMACLDVLNRCEGDVSKLNVDEAGIVRDVAGEIATDVRSFDFSNAPDSDIVEFIEYTYATICERLREKYRDDVPF